MCAVTKLSECHTITILESDRSNAEWLKLVTDEMLEMSCEYKPLVDSLDDFYFMQAFWMMKRI